MLGVPSRKLRQPSDGLMQALLAASFGGRRFNFRCKTVVELELCWAGEGYWGQALPAPANLFQPHLLSDRTQLPWVVGIMNTLGVVLINPGDVDPSGVVTVATHTLPTHPPPEPAGRCLPAATVDLQLTGKSTHPIKGSLWLLLSIANTWLSLGKPPLVPVGV